jgi:hypothetical protein
MKTTEAAHLTGDVLISEYLDIYGEDLRRKYEQVNGPIWKNPKHGASGPDDSIEAMSPSSRSFAADAHGCIMVRILRRSAAYKVAARRHAPYSELPSDRFDRR